MCSGACSCMMVRDMVIATPPQIPQTNTTANASNTWVNGNSDSRSERAPRVGALALLPQRGCVAMACVRAWVLARIMAT